jgi:hypothetical protein
MQPHMHAQMHAHNGKVARTCTGEDLETAMQDPSSNCGSGANARDPARTARLDSLAVECSSAVVAIEAAESEPLAGGRFVAMGG